MNEKRIGSNVVILVHTLFAEHEGHEAREQVLRPKSEEGRREDGLGDLDCAKRYFGPCLRIDCHLGQRQATQGSLLANW